MIAAVAFGLAYLMLVRVLSWLALLPAPMPQRTSRSSCCVTRWPCCAAPTPGQHLPGSTAPCSAR